MAKEKIYLVREEFSNDGEININVYPCKNKGLASTLKERIKTMWNETETHFMGEIFNENTTMYVEEDTNETYFITDPSDDYYLHVSIEECDMINTMEDLNNACRTFN